MRRGAVRVRAAATVLMAAVCAAGPARVSADDASAAHAVVVELFTSQGCSSCPPADRLLEELGRSSGVRIVPLAYHVDFWNHAGWTDPFSSARWTERQVAYARRLGLKDVYTPQAIVDGGMDVVGSLAPELRAAIAKAAGEPAAAVVLRLEASPSEVRVEADVEVPAALNGRKWDLMLAVYETGLHTPVRSGENGGRTLDNDYVVRSLRRVGRVKATSKEKATLPLEKDWDRSRLGVAAFVQDPATLEIRGASARPLGAP